MHCNDNSKTRRSPNDVILWYTKEHTRWANYTHMIKFFVYIILTNFTEYVYTMKTYSIFPNRFFLLALDDNYSKSVKQKHTNNSYVWKKEDDEECKGTWDDTTRKYCICHHNFYGQRSRPKQLSILEWVQYFIRDMR